MASRILVATDGSETGERATACAAELSDKLNRGLTILHVDLHTRPSAELTRLAEAEHLLTGIASLDRFSGFPPASSLGDFYNAAQDEIERSRVISALSEQILERAWDQAERAGARDVRAKVRAGDFVDEILDMAEAEDAGMIVMGRRGLGRLQELVLGSVTQKVLHRTTRTVVVVQ